MGSLAATTGRILSIAVHVGPVPEIQGSRPNETEHVFGIAADGLEQPEIQALRQFLTLMSDFDSESDEIVGHNVFSFRSPLHPSALPRQQHCGRAICESKRI